MSETASSIVALHGNFGSPADWEALLLPDLKGIDLWAYSSLSFCEFSRELATSLTEGFTRPVLAGYSLGGRLALHAMAMRPERWSGAVILSAHPGLSCIEDREARRASDEVWARITREMEWGAFLEKWNSQPVLDGMDRDTADSQFALEPRREAIARAFEAWSLGRQEDLRGSLASFRAPVLWITGGRDEKFTRLGAAMAEVFSNFRHEVIPACGHRVLAENPGQVARMIRKVFPVDGSL